MSFCVMAMFRNESWILNEWIEHYFLEGASQIILIDNESTDDWKKKINTEYKTDPRIKFYSCKGSQENRQMNIYNSIKKHHQFSTEWLMICDLDEFIYSRQDFKTIDQYLKTIPDDISQIKIPWKIFGSSGHEKQPESVIKSFVHWKPIHSKHQVKFKGKVTGVKSIVRISNIKKLIIHAHYVNGKTILVSGKSCKMEDPHCGVYDIKDDPLHMNHYYTQSLEYFDTIQKSRRGGNNPRNIKDIKWFNANKDGNFFDDELAKKEY